MRNWSSIFGKSIASELLATCQKDRVRLQVLLDEEIEGVKGRERQISQLNGEIGQYKEEAELLRAELAASRYRISQLTNEIDDLKRKFENG